MEAGAAAAGVTAEPVEGCGAPGVAAVLIAAGVAGVAAAGAGVAATFFA